MGRARAFARRFGAPQPSDGEHGPIPRPVMSPGEGTSSRSLKSAVFTIDTNDAAARRDRAGHSRRPSHAAIAKYPRRQRSTPGRGSSNVTTCRHVRIGACDHHIPAQRATSECPAGNGSTSGTVFRSRCVQVPIRRQLTASRRLWATGFQPDAGRIAQSPLNAGRFSSVRFAAKPRSEPFSRSN